MIKIYIIYLLFYIYIIDIYIIYNHQILYVSILNLTQYDYQSLLFKDFQLQTEIYNPFLGFLLI